MLEDIRTHQTAIGKLVNLDAYQDPISRAWFNGLMFGLQLAIEILEEEGE